jgi:hypothetical protein
MFSLIPVRWVPTLCPVQLVVVPALALGNLGKGQTVFFVCGFVSVVLAQHERYQSTITIIVVNSHSGTIWLTEPHNCSVVHR